MAVTLTINGQSIEVTDGRSLFDYAEALGIDVPTSCRKQGKCKECMVEVVEGMSALSAIAEPERHLKGSFRLSCQTSVTAGEGHVRCHTMRRGHMRIERHAFGLPLGNRGLQLDPAVTREGDRILMDGVEVERSTGPMLGIAMDLGTTTVVLRLVDDTEHPGRLLMRTLTGYMTHAIEKFPVDPKTIYEMVVVGNSTMRDLFFRQSVYSIGQNPYQSITEIEMTEGKRASTSLIQTGIRSLLPIHPKARVYGGPVISGHVGADAAACMLAVDLAHEERLIAVMDIGTNTELIVGNKDRILAASCPAGPAFEGGAIACGMPALDGAIESVTIDDDGTFRLGVIGDVPPEGICGSGLIDVLSELLRTGRMNDMGRFEDEADRITLHHGETPDKDIFILESDVNELAQAKGANVAGLHTVFSTSVSYTHLRA